MKNYHYRWGNTTIVINMVFTGYISRYRSILGWRLRLYSAMQDRPNRPTQNLTVHENEDGVIMLHFSGGTGARSLFP